MFLLLRLFTEAPVIATPPLFTTYNWVQSLFEKEDKIVCKIWRESSRKKQSYWEESVQKTIENSQMVKRDKLKDFGQVLKGALEYMTGSIGEELKLTMVLTINA